MDLNQYERFSEIDLQNMYQHIHDLPEQLQSAWEIGLSEPVFHAEGIRNVLIAGMGGSAIGADMLAAYISSRCPIPVIVWREYSLPAWAKDSHTLVIASSHSGNTEETIMAFNQAGKQGCQRFVISTGGRLSEMAAIEKVTLWHFDHHGQPRAAVGHSFGLMLAAFYRMNWIPNPQAELDAAVSWMKRQQKEIAAEIPIQQNRAKALALQMVNRWVVVWGADCMAPVARRWKGQINELAKAWAQFEFLPEADHNTLGGTAYPLTSLKDMKTILLRSNSDHTRNRLRIDRTHSSMQKIDLDVDIFEAPGDHPLANMWTALHFGDYVAYYLAMKYESDPTPIQIMQELKLEMGKQK